MLLEAHHGGGTHGREGRRWEDEENAVIVVIFKNVNDKCHNLIGREIHMLKD